MVRVAIAGGTGGLGRTLVEELMQGDDHEIFILSRKVRPCSFLMTAYTVIPIICVSALLNVCTVYPSFQGFRQCSLPQPVL